MHVTRLELDGAPRIGRFSGGDPPLPQARLSRSTIAIALPDKSESRERWLTRDEAARLIRAAWRYREVQKGVETERHSRRHVARFILVGLYTGTRSGAICGAALTPAIGRGWVDLDAGLFYRKALGEKDEKASADHPNPRQVARAHAPLAGQGDFDQGRDRMGRSRRRERAQGVLASRKGRPPRRRLTACAASHRGKLGNA